MKGRAVRLATAQSADDRPATEAGDAEFFAAREGGQLLYDHARRAWFIFDAAGHWRPDHVGEVTQRAIVSMRLRQTAATQLNSDDRAMRVKWALSGESESRIRHLLDLAATSPLLATAGDDWDCDPWLLGVQGGVVDLRTGQLRPGVAADRITRVARVAYDASATCARWDRFIPEVADDDLDLAGYLGRVLGYAITGLTSEQVFFLLHGFGSNGKSTLLETLTRHVLPEHSWTMPFPTAAWTDSMTEYQRAELVGRRIVIAKESENAKALNVEFIKSLTGTDTVNARHPYGRPFTFAPVATVLLACNHRPVIRDESHGMWRRVRLVPFGRTFSVDPALPDRLADEAPGILRWLVESCLEYQHTGLGLPSAVADATADYRRESDPLAAWQSDRCVVADHASVRAGIAWTDYISWCDVQQVPTADRLSLRAFGEAMKRQFTAATGQRVVYHGIGLRDQEGGTL